MSEAAQDARAIRAPLGFGRFVRCFRSIDRLFLLLLALLALGLAITVLIAYRNFQEEKVRAFGEEALYAVRLQQVLMATRLNALDDRIARLASDPEVAAMSPRGEAKLIHFHDFLRTEGYVLAVSRVSPDMRLAFTMPDIASIGADLSHQEHNRRLAGSRQPTFSSPFMAVQGYRSIALHHPIFAADGTYLGGVGVLLDFDRFARHFIDRIEVRGIGQPWVVDGQGEIISFPKGADEARAAVGAALGKGLLGELGHANEGVTPYRRPGSEAMERILAHARLATRSGADWHVCLDATRAEILATLPHFQFFEPTTLYPVLVFLAIAIGLTVAYYLFARSYARSLRDQLCQAQRLEMVNLFIGGITHDFNNIVQVLGGFAELLRMNQGKVGDEELRVVEDLVRRANALTGQLLEFTGRQPHARRGAHADLNAAIHELARMLRYILPHHLHVRLELDEAAPPLLADLRQVEQILMNLCLNARDAMPEGGTMTIGTRLLAEGADQDSLPSGMAKGPCLLLTVADTGIGMTDYVRQHIFDPFFTTKGDAGTGLGLPTVAMIVTDLRGAVRVESRPDQGTRFLVYLPIREG